MGYFNIFYKLTRIIDFFTRKRNRKFILALCLIGGIVFFSPNISNAQGFSSVDSVNINSIKNDVWNTYQEVASIESYISTYFSIYNTNLNTIKSYILDNSTYLIYCRNELIATNTKLTAIQDSLDHIDNDIHDLLIDIDNLLLKIDDLQDTLSQVLDTLESIDQNITYFGDLNHEDQEEIKDLIKQYLYGSNEMFNNSFDVYSGIGIQSTSHIFYNNNGWTTYVIKMHKDNLYEMTLNSSATWVYRFNVYFSTTYIKPVVNYNMSDYYAGFVDLPENSSSIYQYTPTEDGYLYFTLGNSTVSLSEVRSTYNQGQEEGIYGGLTNIQQTTIIQDTQTRETISQESQETRNTITDSSIPTNEMTIDTSIVDGVSNEENDNFLTSIINRFQSVISPSSSVTTIVIPIPKTGKNIVLRSDLLSSHISNTIIGTYITVFWYVVFFIYFFKFAYRVINWVVTGEIIEKPSGFMKYLMEQNAIITASMM